jgi:site-specific recombinase XerD
MNPSFISSRYIASARFGPLTPYVKPYITAVINQGYRPPTIVGHLRLIGRFNRWLRRKGYDLGELNECVSERFLKCQRKKRRTPSGGDPITIQRLLTVLRHAGIVSPAKQSSGSKTSVQQLTDRYRRFLLNDRGLAESTVDNYGWFVGKFLAGQFGNNAVKPGCLQVPDAIAFIRQTARGHSTSHAKHLVAALRALFRFLHYEGKIQSDLAPALPTVAHWALSTLPKYIAAEAVQRVLDKCDQQTSVGRRDYAVLMLLSRLGMRGGEVLRLELEDIDWQNAAITIRAKKGPGWARLPLAADVGKAIAGYLRYDRPRGVGRRVFLRVRAPHAALSHTAVISSLVRRALQKAGVESAGQGAHLFRHSLATSMLRRGASLDEIGQVLRHRSPNSTAIYAKVELNALRPLALSWPGGVL